MKIQILLFFIAIIHSISIFGNNPRKYFELTNKAELAICDSNYTDAAEYYKEAMHCLEEPFGRDIYNLLICGFRNKDSIALQMCADKFIERNYINTSDTFLSNFPDEISSYWRYLTKTSTKKISLDTSFVQLIEELLVLDQVPRQYSINYEKMMKADSLHIRKLQSYMEENKVFISEKYIGNEYNFANFPLRIELLLVHYAGGASERKKKEELINLNLKQKVLEGKFDPKVYANLPRRRGFAIRANSPRLRKIYLLLI